jgi:hypothetical protein
MVGAVDAERFSAPALRRQLEDLHWLEDMSRAHNAVVSQLAQGRPIAPVRLATVFANVENVRELRRTRAQDFVAALDRVRGCCEWAVKGFAVGAEPLPTAVSSEALSPRSVLSGTATR